MGEAEDSLAARLLAQLRASPATGLGEAFEALAREREYPGRRGRVPRARLQQLLSRWASASAGDVQAVNAILAAVPASEDNLVSLKELDRAVASVANEGAEPPPPSGRQPVRARSGTGYAALARRNDPRALPPVDIPEPSEPPPPPSPPPQEQRSYPVDPSYEPVSAEPPSSSALARRRAALTALAATQGRALEALHAERLDLEAALSGAQEGFTAALELRKKAEAAAGAAATALLAERAKTAAVRNEMTAARGAEAGCAAARRQIEALHARRDAAMTELGKAVSAAEGAERDGAPEEAARAAAFAAAVGRQALLRKQAAETVAAERELERAKAALSDAVTAQTAEAVATRRAATLAADAAAEALEGVLACRTALDVSAASLLSLAQRLHAGALAVGSLADSAPAADSLPPPPLRHSLRNDEGSAVEFSDAGDFGPASPRFSAQALAPPLLPGGEEGALQWAAPEGTRRSSPRRRGASPSPERRPPPPPDRPIPRATTGGSPMRRQWGNAGSSAAHSRPRGRAVPP